LETGATTVVPGHGPILDRAGVRDHIAAEEAKGRGRAAPARDSGAATPSEVARSEQPVGAGAREEAPVRPAGR
ncbi:hypothetical protein ACWC5G_35185, partial [Streptomyces sp. NPDC001274]